MDDLHFTISFNMWLKLAWVDNRIKLETQNCSNRAVFPSSVGTNPNIKTIGLVDMDLLEHIWTPQVMLPHQKLAKCLHGPPFHDQVLNIIVKNETVWVDFWSMMRITITCPMTFNWYPFDVQSCDLFIQVRSEFPYQGK